MHLSGILLEIRFLIMDYAECNLGNEQNGKYEKHLEDIPLTKKKKWIHDASHFYSVHACTITIVTRKPPFK